MGVAVPAILFQFPIACAAVQIPAASSSSTVHQLVHRIDHQFRGPGDVQFGVYDSKFNDPFVSNLSRSFFAQAPNSLNLNHLVAAAVADRRWPLCRSC